MFQESIGKQYSSPTLPHNTGYKFDFFFLFRTAPFISSGRSSYSASVPLENINFLRFWEFLPIYMYFVIIKCNFIMINPDVPDDPIDPDDHDDPVHFFLTTIVLPLFV